MPRRPPLLITGIPLFLIGPVTGHEAQKAGETLVRIVIREVKGHFFNISVHTRAVCRRVFRYRPRVPETDTESGSLSFSAGVADP